MKKTPPLPGTPRNILYPDVPQAVLGNGLTVLTVEDHHLPRVAVRLGFPVGRVNDPGGRIGLTQLTVDMLKEGTSRRSSQQIAEALDQHAVHFDYQVFSEQSHLSVTSLKGQLEPALELLSEMVLSPAFVEPEFEKVKARWMSQIVAQRSDPSFLANERIVSQLFRGHPYSNVSVAAHTIEAVELGELRSHFLDWFCASDGIVVFSGSVTPAESLELTKRFFTDLPLSARDPIQYPELNPIPGDICLVHRPHSVQSELLVGTRTLRHSDPFYLPLKVTNQVLGGGASARLFLNLREDKGYTYGAYSYLRSFREDGVFLAGASVKSEATGEALDETFQEIQRLQAGVPSEEELVRSRAELGGAFVRQMETPSSIASLELVKRLDNLSPDYYRKFLPRLEAVTPSEVRQTANQYLGIGRMSVVVVADRQQVEPMLRERGECEVFDVEGNRIT